jgi:hypothetical protein
MATLRTTPLCANCRTALLARDSASRQSGGIQWTELPRSRHASLTFPALTMHHSRTPAESIGAQSVGSLWTTDLEFRTSDSSG